MATVIALMILAVTAVLYALSGWWCLTVRDDGIVARTYLGFKKILLWDDILSSTLSYGDGIPYISIESVEYSLWVLALGFDRQELRVAIRDASGKELQAFENL